jgi:hypothetical protein
MSQTGRRVRLVWVAIFLCQALLVAWQGKMVGGFAYIAHMGQTPAFFFGVMLSTLCLVATFAKDHGGLLPLLILGSVVQFLALLGGYGYLLLSGNRLVPLELLVHPIIASPLLIVGTLAPIGAPVPFVYALPIWMFIVATNQLSKQKAMVLDPSVKPTQDSRAL